MSKISVFALVLGLAFAISGCADAQSVPQGTRGGVINPVHSTNVHDRCGTGGSKCRPTCQPPLSGGTIRGGTGSNPVCR